MDSAGPSGTHELGLTLVLVDVNSADELETAFASMKKSKAEALFVYRTALTFVAGKQIADLAIEAHLPSCHSFRETVLLGTPSKKSPAIALMMAEITGQSRDQASTAREARRFDRTRGDYPASITGTPARCSSSYRVAIVFRCPPCRAVGKQDALFRACESHEEACGFFNLIPGKTPPCSVIETNKNYGVIFESLALVDRHERQRVDALIDVKRLPPLGLQHATRLEMQGDRFLDFLHPIALAIGGTSGYESRAADEIEHRFDDGLGVRL
jgi:hypothetical protein